MPLKPKAPTTAKKTKPSKAKSSTTRKKINTVGSAAKPDFTELVLSCGSWQEAQKIADSLLNKRLVACVEFLVVHSKYRWHDTLEEAKEVKLIMQALADNFKSIEAEVAKLHSYETYVLQALPVHQVSADAAV